MRRRRGRLGAGGGGEDLGAVAATAETAAGGSAAAREVGEGRPLGRARRVRPGRAGQARLQARTEGTWPERGDRAAVEVERHRRVRAPVPSKGRLAVEAKAGDLFLILVGADV